jgi:hypothetical protein
MIRAAIILALTLPSTLAWGETANEPYKAPSLLKRSASLHLPSLAVRGLSGQFEHYTFAKHRMSLSATGSMRLNARLGDYSSYSYGAGAELRYWFTGRPIWSSSLAPGAMAGPYVGGRLDLMHTRVKDEVDNRTIGGAVTIAESLAFGYRFVWRDRIEMTPSLEISVRTETDTSDRLGAWTRVTLGFGWTLGYMF